MTVAGYLEAATESVTFTHDFSVRGDRGASGIAHLDADLASLALRQRSAGRQRKKCGQQKELKLVKLESVHRGNWPFPGRIEVNVIRFDVYSKITRELWTFRFERKLGTQWALAFEHYEPV